MQDDRAKELAPAALECICPLQYRLPLTAAQSNFQVCVDDREGHRVLTLFGLETDERAAVMDLVRLANAYPRLKAALDKALEACRLIEAAERLEEKGWEIARTGNPQLLSALSPCFRRSFSARERARRAAREALEEAERDG